jgi:O-succinylbenzoic acid--CoA ligase
MDTLSESLSLTRAAADPASAARSALLAAGVAYSFADLADRAARLRAALACEGVGLGTRVALIAKNSVETVVAVHAILDLGATLVPIHPRLTPAEAEVLLADAAPMLTLRDADLRVSAPAPAPAPAHAPDLPLALLYTSGTTGRSKGAILSRRAFAAAAAASEQNLGWADDDRWLLCMPLCHVGGLSIVTRCLAARRAVILEPRFDPDAVLAAVARERATLLSVVPTMLQALLDRDRDNVLARLRAVLLGGAGAPFALLEECGRRGVPALTTYGLTEACSQVTVQRISRPYRAERGSGVPLPGVELRVACADGFRSTLAGEVGRLHVRGPTLMDGYFRGVDCAPDRARDREGWFDTGDVGELDEGGALHVHARRSDLIVTGGENVYPVEVEQRLEALKGVQRALVFGVPDERWGQLVAAAIELAPGTALEAIVEQSAAVLASHKRPRLACTVASLPLTASGKLERAGAAARYAAVLRPWGGRG